MKRTKTKKKGRFRRNDGAVGRDVMVEVYLSPHYPCPVWDEGRVGDSEDVTVRTVSTSAFGGRTEDLEKG